MRLIDDAAFITVKSDGLLTRQEYEYPLPAVDARAMLPLTPWSPIEKTRFRLALDGRVWEVDRYEGDNAGLWSAEVELATEDEALVLPPWLADEVTSEPRFKNVNLAQRPFAGWPDRERVLRLIDA